MPSVEPTEVFVTIFDSNFLLSGMALHESLMAHSPRARLFIVAVDELVEQQLQRLNLTNVSILPLRDIETPALRSVKTGRTRGEYCWTLTPFLADAVLEREPAAAQVTYLDADLFFFDDPATLLAELAESAKSVLITEHAYAPRYDRSYRSGRFCVQFLTFRRDPSALAVSRWWQDRCLEWCFARYEPGRFGDQMYLDRWPELFASSVQIVRRKDRTLAPWNVDWFSRGRRANPVFYHFQGFRILRPNRVKLYHGYSVASRNRWIYDAYLASIARAAIRVRALGYDLPTMPEHRQRWRSLKYLLMLLARRIQFVDLSSKLGAGTTDPRVASEGRA